MSVLLIASTLAAALAVHAAPKAPASVYDFKMKNIDGQEVALSQFKGKVLLFVNVATY